MGLRLQKTKKKKRVYGEVYWFVEYIPYLNQFFFFSFEEKIRISTILNLSTILNIE